jgi:hypothetical protein
MSPLVDEDEVMGAGESIEHVDTARLETLEALRRALIGNIRALRAGTRAQRHVVGSTEFCGETEQEDLQTTGRLQGSCSTAHEENAAARCTGGCGARWEFGAHRKHCPALATSHLVASTSLEGAEARQSSSAALNVPSSRRSRRAAAASNSGIQ